jgi:cytochrome b-561 domain-containing protein 2
MWEGLLVFNRESSLFVNVARPTKVLIHQVLNMAAVVCAILGFTVIYYNKSINDKPHFTTWHGLLGLITVIYITAQSLGGDVVKYEWLRRILGVRMSLGKLKIYHATSGLVAFTLVVTTMMLALYSTWFTSQVGWVLWLLCNGSVSFMAVIIMNQVVTEYLPKTQRQTVAAPLPTKKTSQKSGSSRKNKKSN